jgi:hypothetical protein
MYTYELLWKNNEIFEDHKNGYPIYFDFIYRWENPGIRGDFLQKFFAASSAPSSSSDSEVSSKPSTSPANLAAKP